MIFLIKISRKKTFLLLKDKITGEIIEKFYSYDDHYYSGYRHVTLKPKYREENCCGFESIFIPYFNFIFEKFEILTEYIRTIENIYKNNLTEQLCKKYLNNDIKTIIEGYL